MVLGRAEPADEVRPPRGRRIRRSRLYRLLSRKGALFGLVVVSFFLIAALLAPRIAPYPPNKMDYSAIRQPPSAEHWFGTDDLGRDVLSRVIHGARISMQVGVIAVGLSLVVGTLMGIIAGFAGGLVDTILMRIIDIMLAFPGILLAIAIVAILGPDLFNTMIAVGIAAIPTYARTARASTLGVLETEYVQAARALGATNLRIVRQHVFPNILAPITVLATIGIAIAILSAAGLSYLGLGAQPPTPEWGAMLSEARGNLRDAWWMSTFPGVAIMLVILGFNLLGDGLQDVLDPRMGHKR